MLPEGAWPCDDLTGLRPGDRSPLTEREHAITVIFAKEKPAWSQRNRRFRRAQKDPRLRHIGWTVIAALVELAPYREF